MTDQPADDGHAQQAYAEQMHRTLGGLNAKVRELGQQLRAAEDELQMLRPLPAQLAAAQAELSALHEGEEPYDDDRMIPTPGQWITLWNRATPAERLEIAAYRLELLDRVDRCNSEMHRARVGELHEYRQAWSALQGRADLAEAERDEARSWARHGYEIGQRHCGWTDHGVAPAWLTEGWPLHIDSCEHSADLLAAEGRTARYRTAWRSARQRAARATGTLDGVRSNLAAGTPLICSDERHAAKVAALETRIAAARALADTLDAEEAYGGARDAKTDAADRIRSALDGPADQPAEVSRSLGGMVDRMLGGHVGAAFVAPADQPAAAQAEPCDHRDPKRLGARPYDLAVICACGTEVMPGIRPRRQTEQEVEFAADVHAVFVAPFAAMAARAAAEAALTDGPAVNASIDEDTS